MAAGRAEKKNKPHDEVTAKRAGLKLKRLGDLAGRLEVPKKAPRRRSSSKGHPGVQAPKGRMTTEQDGSAAERVLIHASSRAQPAWLPETMRGCTEAG